MDLREDGGGVVVDDGVCRDVGGDVGALCGDASGDLIGCQAAALLYAGDAQVVGGFNYPRGIDVLM